MKAPAMLNNPNAALMLAAAAAGIYLVYRVFNTAEALGGAVSDGAKALATGAGNTIKAVDNVAKVANAYTPVGMVTAVGSAVMTPVVKAVQTGGISAAAGDLVDWLRGTAYDPNK